MPSELQIAVGVVAILGFVLSAFLETLRLLEWRAKPDLRLDMDWIAGSGPTTLRLAAVNRGRRAGTVRRSSSALAPSTIGVGALSICITSPSFRPLWSPDLPPDSRSSSNQRPRPTSQMRF